MSIRFFDKITKKTVVVPFDDELKEKLAEYASFYPYPIIIQHDGHFTILHLDPNGNDRGTVQSNIFIRLDKKRIDNVIDYSTTTKRSKKTTKRSKKTTKRSKKTTKRSKKTTKRSKKTAKKSKKTTKRSKKTAKKSKNEININLINEKKDNLKALKKLSGFGLDDL
ncbi:MAG: hypothetical protein ACTSRZ_06000 [Promethearchaeota archaeon]